jgi:hypothetical protein
MATDWYVQLLCNRYEISNMFATRSFSDAEAKWGARRTAESHPGRALFSIEQRSFMINLTSPTLVSPLLNLA